MKDQSSWGDLQRGVDGSLSQAHGSAQSCVCKRAGGIIHILGCWMSTMNQWAQGTCSRHLMRSLADCVGPWILDHARLMNDVTIVQRGLKFMTHELRSLVTNTSRWARTSQKATNSQVVAQREKASRCCLRPSTSGWLVSWMVASAMNLQLCPCSLIVQGAMRLAATSCQKEQRRLLFLVAVDRVLDRATCNVDAPHMHA